MNDGACFRPGLWLAARLQILWGVGLLLEEGVRREGGREKG